MIPQSGLRKRGLKWFDPELASQFLMSHSHIQSKTLSSPRPHGLSYLKFTLYLLFPYLVATRASSFASKKGLEQAEQTIRRLQI